MVALGASYGGYMVNWIAGQQWQQKYKSVARDRLVAALW
jgi:dipeptidyl aminopeptidase/acylaminoacyl peptidase